MVIHSDLPWHSHLAHVPYSILCAAFKRHSLTAVCILCSDHLWGTHGRVCCKRKNNRVRRYLWDPTGIPDMDNLSHHGQNRIASFFDIDQAYISCLVLAEADFENCHSGLELRLGSYPTSQPTKRPSECCQAKVAKVELSFNSILKNSPALTLDLPFQFVTVLASNLSDC